SASAAQETDLNSAWVPAMGIVRSLLRSSRTPAPATAIGSTNVVHQRTKLEAATLTSRKDPVYPASAKENLISGSVEVHFRISPQGKVYDAKSVKGAPILAQAAIEAVREWRYEPARLNGIAIDSHASTNFTFD